MTDCERRINHVKRFTSSCPQYLCVFFIYFDLQGGLQTGRHLPLGYVPVGGRAGSMSESKCDMYKHHTECINHNSSNKVDIHISVHHKHTSNSKLQPTRYNVSWFIYFCRRSTSFRRFLRPSSGAHYCTYSFRYCQSILLFAAIVYEMELHRVPSHTR